MGKKLLVGVALVGMSLVAAACGGGDDDDDAPSDSGLTDVELLLPVPENPSMIGYTIAQDRTFEENGVRVEGLATDGSPVVMQQLVSGQAEMGLATGVSAYIAASQGEDIRVIATLQHDDTFLLTVPEDSAVESIEDLEGESIGVTSLGDGAVPILRAALRDAGLDPANDVTMAVVGDAGPAIAKALKDGRVAAFASGLHNLPSVEAEGGVPLRKINPPKYDELVGTSLVTTQATLDDPGRRDAAIAVARGILAGSLLAKDDPELAYEIACARTPESCADEEATRLLVDLAIDSNTPLDLERPGYNDLTKIQVVVDALSDEVEQPAPSIEEVFTNEFNEEIGDGL